MFGEPAISNKVIVLLDHAHTSNIDCLYQCIWYLISLIFSCLFGTFLYNSEFDRFKEVRFAEYT